MADKSNLSPAALKRLEIDRLKVYTQKINIMLGVLDDDPEFRKDFKEKLISKGLVNHAIYSRGEMLLADMTTDWHVIVLDHYGVGAMNGLQYMEKILEKNPLCFVIIYSRQESRRVVIDYLNKGAYAYVDKNEKTEKESEEELIQYIESALASIQSEVVYFSGIDEKIQRAEKTLINRDKEKELQDSIEKIEENERSAGGA